MKTVSLCGSTGSIGRSACRILAAASHLNCETLIFGRNEVVAREQIALLKPAFVGCLEKESALNIKKDFPFIREAFYGEGTLEAAAQPADIFLSAVSGSAGMAYSFAALQGARRIALANKETLVMAGELFMNEVQKKGITLLPVDSEHNALFQCLQGEEKENIESLILTASGGPFRGFSREELAHVTPEQALRHPTWSMGEKITIDSATLVNKGLEVIEAVRLFGFEENSIEVIVHPQSVIHSMVRMKDGSLKALMGSADMRLPIAYAFDYPRRARYQWEHWDPVQTGTLTFELPDENVFPSLALARLAIKEGGLLPLVYNRVNEECVAAFLEERIMLTDIFYFLELYLEEYGRKNRGLESVDDVKAADLEVSRRIKKDLELR